MNIVDEAMKTMTTDNFMTVGLTAFVSLSADKETRQLVSEIIRLSQQFTEQELTLSNSEYFVRNLLQSDQLSPAARKFIEDAIFKLQAKKL